MRTYRQYCALARALDVVGDRWTLLIVRELLVRQPCRYTDLAYGLPGIATNLLADRLRQLEENGLITREAAPPPIAATLFRLTARGEALRPVVQALGLWGRPLMEQPPGSSEFRSHWLVIPLERHLVDRTPSASPVSIEIRTGEQAMTIATVDGRVRVRPGPVSDPAAIVTGPPDLVLGLLFGRLDPQAAGALGLKFEGDRAALSRMQPSTEVDESPPPDRRGER